MITSQKMNPYTDNFIRIFRSAANPEKAGPMKAYMKNRFGFLGINSPARKELIRPFLMKNALPSTEELRPIIQELWEMPEREYQYVAMELFSRYNRVAEESWIDLYHHMITEKSWWDTVDFIAATLVGNYFRKFPESINLVTDRWIRSENIWLQRSCLLFQLKYKRQTDTALLSSFIMPLAHRKDFFIAKAIGWALREYSKTDPGWVLDFVNGQSLQPLSRKEALKRISS
ncbi:MAG: DNA alkylation repair protein [Cyclobacteriaceae bacterium]|nr:DNA alkylation repair protein [Cyclobacteriaceae bacterium]